MFALRLTPPKCGLHLWMLPHDRRHDANWHFIYCSFLSNNSHSVWVISLMISQFWDIWERLSVCVYKVGRHQWFNGFSYEPYLVYTNISLASLPPLPLLQPGPHGQSRPPPSQGCSTRPCASPSEVLCKLSDVFHLWCSKWGRKGVSQKNLYFQMIPY